MQNNTSENKLCPLCGNENHCTIKAIKNNNHCSEDCWCFNETFPSKSLPTDKQACICYNCLTVLQAEE